MSFLQKVKKTRQKIQYYTHGMAWHEGASWYHAYGHQQNGLHESNIYLTQVAICFFR